MAARYHPSSSMSLSNSLTFSGITSIMHSAIAIEALTHHDTPTRFEGRHPDAPGLALTTRSPRIRSASCMTWKSARSPGCRLGTIHHPRSPRTARLARQFLGADRPQAGGTLIAPNGDLTKAELKT